MRQIVLDTETTGIGHEHGHRVIEIGCVELIERKLTGRHFHVYLNPQRAVDEGAFRVHGISDEFLKDKPFFQDVVADFVGFVEGAELIIHNAVFDVGFLNSEFSHVRWGKKLEEHCTVFDTLLFAREKFPGQRNSLDALCKRFSIDHFNRELHGALLDAEILALAYLALTGGQSKLFAEDEQHNQKKAAQDQRFKHLNLPNPVILAAEPGELAEHQQFIEFLVNKSGVNHWVEDKELA